MPVDAKQVDKLFGQLFRVESYNLQDSGAGFTTGLTAAINSVLAGLGTPLGGDLQNTYDGNNSQAGLACTADLAMEVRVSANRDTLQDIPSSSEISAIISRRVCNNNTTINTAIGLNVDFLSQGCSVGNCQIQVTHDIGSGDTFLNLQFSNDGGSTWGTAVNVLGESDDAVFRLDDNAGTAYMFVRISSYTTLSGVTSPATQTVGVDNTNYGGGFCIYDDGRVPVYVDGSTPFDVDFLIPAVVHWSQLDALDMILDQGFGFLDAVDNPADLFKVEYFTLAALNPSLTLGYIPTNVRQMTVEANGVDLSYDNGSSPEFGLSGQQLDLAGASSVYATNRGYNLNTGDKIVVKYWRR